jgi:hypothetical protein
MTVHKALKGFQEVLYQPTLALVVNYAGIYFRRKIDCPLSTEKDK